MRERLTFRHTLSPLCWTLMLGLEPLDMPSMAHWVYRYLLTKHIDTETALYSLFEVEVEQGSYLLLLCKKHVYKGVWRESPSSVQWFAFVTPRDDTARKIERACSRMYAGWRQHMSFPTPEAEAEMEVPIVREERIMSWIEPITEELSNRHWEMSREVDGRTENMAYDCEGEEEDTGMCERSLRRGWRCSC